MADFGKLDFSVAFNPTSAFPIDARCHFTSLVLAEAAAASAKEIGSKDTKYYYGMRLCVDDGTSVKWYTIRRDNTLDPLEDGLTPFIGENGNWWIGETDTGVQAQGEDGVAGLGMYYMDEVTNTTPGSMFATINTQISYLKLGERELQVGDLVLSKDGHLFRVSGIGSPTYMHFTASYLATLAVQGEDGETGFGVYYLNWETQSPSTIGGSLADVETGGRELQVGDLLISKDGLLYRVTSLPSAAPGLDYDAEYLATLHGNTPFIGANNNWWIGETDTGVKAVLGEFAVMYDQAQELTAEQQAQARENIGIVTKTQEEYDALLTAGNIDNNILYLIVESDSL